MNREKKIILTSLLGILANVLLVTGKAIVGILSNSISIISDALNNLTDALSSTITIIGTKIANRKPDKKHPFGHGRVEYITTVIIGVIILVAGITAIVESIDSLIRGTISTYSYVSIIIISIATVVKIAIGLYFRHVGKKTNSGALIASGTDALFDALLSLSTIVGIVVSIFTGVQIEGYLGIGIGLFIIKSGIQTLWGGFSSIVGERSEQELVDKLKQLAFSFKEVKGVYDIILNNYGPNKTIGSLHIEVGDKLTAKEIHPLTRKISALAYVQLGIILTVGIYAQNDEDGINKDLRECIIDAIKEYPRVKQLHGLYIDEEHQQITFDLIFDFEDKNVGKEIEEIKAKIKQKYPEYNTYIVIDTDFSE